MIDEDCKEYAKLIHTIEGLNEWKERLEKNILGWLKENGNDAVASPDGVFYAIAETKWKHTGEIATLEDMLGQAKEDEIDRGIAKKRTKIVLKFKAKKS